MVEDIFEKDKHGLPPPPVAEAPAYEVDTLSLAYPDEMILNSEILGIFFHSFTYYYCSF